jgi:hypothetical protein
MVCKPNVLGSGVSWLSRVWLLNSGKEARPKRTGTQSLLGPG